MSSLWPEDDDEQPTVMIVEDDPAIRRLYSFLLSNAGYEVLEAEDGQVALEHYEEQPCHLIITDMNMPRMGGMDLVRELRKKRYTVYIIMVTAYGTTDTKKMAFRLGANEYIPKPFDFEELKGRTRNYFEESGFFLP
jgi:DNA-binding response OmpR family regulator